MGVIDGNGGWLYDVLDSYSHATTTTLMHTHTTGEALLPHGLGGGAGGPERGAGAGGGVQAGVICGSMCVGVDCNIDKRKKKTIASVGFGIISSVDFCYSNSKETTSGLILSS